MAEPPRDKCRELHFFEHRDDKHRSHAALFDRRDGEGIALQITLIFREVRHMHGLPRPLDPTERRQWPGLKGLVLHLLDKLACPPRNATTRNPSLSARNRKPSLAWQIRIAFSSIA